MQKTKIDKDKIKRAIKFRKKEPIKDESEDKIVEENAPTAVQPTQQFVGLGYITKVDGSVIIRLG